MALVNDPNFSFPAIRGIQSGREFYTIMCPLKYVPKLFSFNEEVIDPQLRAQRTLNKARIPEIKKYILNKDYVFSALTASIDGEIKFEPVDKENFRIGTLHIPLDSKLLINDGQHRRAAIQEALKEDPNLGYETISIVIFPDRGLKHSQQMFCDLNKFAVKPSQSLSILYNKRDDFSQFIISILKEITVFNNKTEMEKTSISNRSNKIFTLNIISTATKNFLGKSGNHITISSEEKKLVIKYWKVVAENMVPWQEIIKGEKTPFEIREESICTHGIILQPLGIVGNQLIKNKNWEESLKKLSKMDWNRTNKEFQGNAIINGRLSKTATSIKLTSELIAKKLGVELK